MTDLTLVTIQVALTTEQIATIAGEAAAAGVAFDHTAAAILVKGLYHLRREMDLIETISFMPRRKESEGGHAD